MAIERFLIVEPLPHILNIIWDGIEEAAKNLDKEIKSWATTSVEDALYFLAYDAGADSVIANLGVEDNLSGIRVANAALQHGVFRQNIYLHSLEFPPDVPKLPVIKVSSLKLGPDFFQTVVRGLMVGPN